LWLARGHLFGLRIFRRTAARRVDLPVPKQVNDFGEDWRNGVGYG